MRQAGDKSKAYSAVCPTLDADLFLLKDDDGAALDEHLLLEFGRLACKTANEAIEDALEDKSLVKRFSHEILDQVPT